MPLADCRIGVERVPGGVHAREHEAVLAQLALEAVALAGVAQERVEVEVVGLLPAADAHLDVGDATLGAPAQGVHAGQVGQSVVEEADLQLCSPG